MGSLGRTHLVLLRLLRWRNRVVRSSLCGGPLEVSADLVRCSPDRTELLSSVRA